jgi:predicted metal-binding membrane protein
MSFDNAIERVVKRDRTIVLGALIAVVGLSWAYVLAGAGMSMSALELTRMNTAEDGMAKMMPAVWDIGYAGVMFIMWWIMMIAMMLPSATPMVLLFAAMNRKQREKGSPYVATAHFASAYLIVWAGFSVVAVALQWGLEALALLSPMMISASAVFWRRSVVSRGHLSTHAHQVSLSETLPLTAAVRVGSLAQRYRWSLSHGNRTWRVLRRLLLVPNGAVVFRWRDEPILDHRSCRLCSC